MSNSAVNANWDDSSPFPNPNTTKRAEYTAALINCDPIQSNASPKFANLANALNNLYEKLAEYPAMAPNLQQTFSTPAKSKTKVYFLWDFGNLLLYPMLGIFLLILV